MDECLFWIVPISILTIRRKNMETTKPTIDPPFTVLSGPCFKTNVWRGKIAREDLIMETLHMHKTLPLGVSAFPKARWNTLQVFVNLGVFDIWKKHIAGYVPIYETTPLREQGLFRNRQCPVTSAAHLGINQWEEKIIPFFARLRAGIICSMYMYVNNMISVLLYAMQCCSIQICSIKFYSVQVSSILF